MTTDIKIGSTVNCPVTDAEGEVSHRFGKLVDMNRRYAAVEIDGKIVKVGKTKIELVEVEEEKPTKGKGRLDRSQYQSCRSASGRKSLDNGDTTALMLRGKTLGEVYAIAEKILEEPMATLVAKYEHLNPGQQRMILGNRLRKAQ